MFRARRAVSWALLCAVTALSPALAVAPPSGSWTSETPLPAHRVSASLVRVGSLLYYIGGNFNAREYATVRAYDPVSGSWTFKRAMPTARNSFYAAAVSSKIYVAGGWTGAAMTTVVEAYDAVADSWTTKAAMPAAAGSGAVIAYNGKLYALTGAIGGVCVSNSYVYDPAGDSWTALTGAPTARCHARAAVYGGLIYVVGGSDTAGTPFTTVEAYDPVGNSWSSKASLQTARYLGGVAVSSSSIYAVAGTTGNGVGLSSVEVYDPVGNSWSYKSPAPKSRVAFAMETGADGLFYAVGGADSSAANQDVLEIDAYDPTSDAWSVKAARVPGPRRDAAAVAVSSASLFLVGGQDGEGPTDLLQHYDATLARWDRSPLAMAMLPSRSTSPVAAVLNGTMYAAGGMQTSTVASSGLWSYDATAGTWTARAAMPTAGGCGAAGAINGKLYVLVSCDGTAGGAKALAAYDPQTNAWTSKTAAPNVHRGPAFGVIGGKLYVAGGTDGTGTASATLDVYDPATNAWTTKRAMSAARVGPASGAMAGGYLVAAGGDDGVGGKLATVEVYDAAADSWSAGPSLPTARSGAAGAVLGARLFAIGGASTAGDTSVVEALTVTLATGPSVSTVSPSSAPTGTSAALALTGVGFDGTASLTLEAPVAYSSWTVVAASTMNVARAQPQAVRLRDGRILFAGGRTGGNTALTSAEVYDPASGAWISVSSMNVARFMAASALLNDGRVLVIGGRYDVNNSTPTDLTACEVYDPAADSWTPTGSLATGRSNAWAFVRPDGKVLVAGGFHSPNNLASVEVWDPATGAWTAGPPMSAQHNAAAVVVLKDGRFMIAGGSGASGVQAVTEAYDPVGNSWTTLSPMNTARYAHALAVLPDGRVLTAGGATASAPTSTAEVYDPTGNSWTNVGGMGASHGSASYALFGGKVLVTGGTDTPGALARTDLFDPASLSWSTGPALGYAMVYAPLVPLDDGRLLLAGGGTGGYPAPSLASVQMLTASWATRTASAVSVPDSQHLSGNLSLLGAATGYWDVVVRESGGRVSRAYAGFQVSTQVALIGLSAFPARGYLVVGSSRAFSAAGVFNDGSTRTVTGTWSSDSANAGVTGGGFVTAAAAGTAHLTVSSGAFSSVSTVTVVAPWPAVSAVAPSTGAVGATALLNVAGSGFDATAALSLEAPMGSAWTESVGTMTVARAQPQVLPLPDGRVLIAGGRTGAVTSLAGGETFDPVSGTVAAAASMKTARFMADAVALRDGRVLIAGGRFDVNNASPSDLTSAEVYDAATDSWTATGSLATGRSDARAFLRPDGKVLVAGGYQAPNNLASTEVWDPATGSWSPGPPMNAQHNAAAAVVLKDGRFLVSGGSGASGVQAACEVYDPSANTWTSVASMNTARYNHALVVLPDGRVLAAGGATASAPTPAAEVYDPTTDSWAPVSAMPVAHTAAHTALVAGKVYVAGGLNASGTLARAEVFDPATLSWSTGPALAAAAVYGALVPLGDGRLLLAGGATGGYPAPAMADLQVLTASGASIAASGVSVPDAAHAAGSVDLTGAAAGYYDVVVRQSGGRAGRLVGAFAVRSNPSVPTLSGAAIGVSSLTWSWTAVAGQAGYRVLTSTGGDRSGVISTTTTNWTETGLGPNSATTRLVRAFDAVGSTVTSASKTVYTRANPPTGSAAAAVYFTSATVSWGLNGNPSGTLASVERSTTGASFAAAYSSGVVSWTDTGLLSCTSYYYRVRDFNGDGLASGYDATVTVLTKTAPPRAPASLTAKTLSGGLLVLSWDASPSTGTLTAYRLYMSTGVLDYLTPYAVLPATATAYTTPALSTGTLYRFGLRAFDGSCSGADDGNTDVVVSASPLYDASQVRAAIKVPESGKKVSGNRLTVMAEIVSGDPSRVHAVRFQYRAAVSTFAAWGDVVAVDALHPNPALGAPYFVHWDVTALANGPYELRAVAVDSDLVADPVPPTIVIGVDAVDHDIDETVVGGSQRKAETVYSGAARTVGTADSASGAVVEVALPAGAVSASTDTLTVQVNPAGTPLPGVGQNAVGQALQITLGSGQTALNGTASIVMHYSDADGNGVVDGTAYRVDDLQIFSYDAASGKWRKESASVVDKTAKTVTATTPHFSLFGLFAAAAADLSSVLVYPVPWVPNDGIDDNGKPYSPSDATSGIVFDGLTAGVRVQVYSASGSLVWEYSTAASGGRVQWDGRGLSGRDAASGGYIAVITDTATRARAVRKIAIIR